MLPVDGNDLSALPAIPPSRAAPLQSDDPNQGEATDKNFTVIDGKVGASGTAVLIRNVTYFGHSKFTEPAPSTDLREFSVDLPATCNRRYLARILPEGFCFDHSCIAYAEKGELLYADVLCN
ncbi:hypothetical protein CPY51_28000 [Rhizobium tubonense]|uniref:Uncharacterized protein n=1 Tax=Rhizobium tubonense TaxID=484088 RepID=A0A2W4CTT4_9HYPH|nr:hypothetical protein CPY51_28000 [Rhizobium tubonense]